MKPAAAPHPSPDCLRLFGTGQLSADEAASVEAHVSDCPDCGEALRGVADDPFIALVRRATSAPPSLPSPHGWGKVGVGEGTTPQFASRLPGGICADSTSPDAQPATPGIVEIPEELREHPRYRVLELLGHGGMGAVYKAEHRLMQRTVALKLIARDLTKRPEVTERFVRETQTAGRLAHANIAQAFDAEQAGGTLFLVMEFVPGTDLARLVRERGPLPCIEACRYVRQAALALQHAHERGMVHRDIKPHNLMLTPDGEIKVLDFGLARFVLGQPLASASQLTEEGLFMGTADYVAPEQARDAHQADIRADVYSLGCTLYHLLTGLVPFPATTVMDKVIKHATEQPAALSALRPDLPANLEDVVMKMIAKLPAQRYQTPGEVAKALAPFATAAVTVIPLAQPVRLGSMGIMTEAGLVREPAGALTQTVVLPAGAGSLARGRWGRRLIAVAAGLLFVATALAGVVVYRIQTDMGEIVIRTVDDDVEVVVKQGGKVVTIYDPKTKQKLVLRSGTYELELKGAPEGLKLNIDKATVTRGGREVAKIERVAKDKPPKASDNPPAKEKVGKGRRFTGHTDMARYVTYSPDGRRALSAGFDGTIRLWSVDTGEQLRQFRGHTQPWIFQALFSPDGRQAISCGADGTIRLWDVETGKQERLFQGHQGAVFGVAFAPDGQHFLSGGADGIVRLWDVSTGEEVRRFLGHKEGVYSVAFSPNGKLAVSGSMGRWPGGHHWTVPADASVRLWEVATGKELHCLKGHTHNIGTVAFSPDSRRVVSGSDDRDARVWDVVTGKLLLVFGHDGIVLAVAFSPDGRSVLSGGWDNTLRLWDPATGVERYTSQVGAGVMCATFSSDGVHALLGLTDGTVRLWRLPDPPAAKGKP
jgi:WD40 repeat protein